MKELSFSQGEHFAAEHEIETNVHFERIRQDLLAAFELLPTETKIESSNVEEVIRDIEIDLKGLDYSIDEPKKLAGACIEQFETALNMVEFKNEIAKKSIFDMLDIWRNPDKDSKKKWGNERF